MGSSGNAENVDGRRDSKDFDEEDLAKIAKAQQAKKHSKPHQSVVRCAVLDGHGEHGDGVSQTFRDQLAHEMFHHPAWATNLKTTTADVIAKCERNLLSPRSCA